MTNWMRREADSSADENRNLSHARVGCCYSGGERAPLEAPASLPPLGAALPSPTGPVFPPLGPSLPPLSAPGGSPYHGPHSPFSHGPLVPPLGLAFPTLFSLVPPLMGPNLPTPGLCFPSCTAHGSSPIINVYVWISHLVGPFTLSRAPLSTCWRGLSTGPILPSPRVPAPFLSRVPSRRLMAARRRLTMAPSRGEVAAEWARESR